MVIPCHANPRVSHHLAKPHGELGDGSNSDTCLKFWMLYWQTSLAIFNHPNSPVSWVSILKKAKAIYCRNWSSLRVALEVADMVSSVLLVNPLICFSIEVPHFLGQMFFFCCGFFKLGYPKTHGFLIERKLMLDDFWVLHFWRNLTLLLINIYIYISIYISCCTHATFSKYLCSQQWKPNILAGSIPMIQSPFVSTGTWSWS